MKRSYLIALPDDCTSSGYKQVGPYKWEQTFKNEDFEGTAEEFVEKGLGYKYVKIDKYTQLVVR